MLQGADGARVVRETSAQALAELPAVTARWADAREGAIECMAQALQRWPRALEVPASRWLEVSLETLLERAIQVARREAGVGGRCYIGSTSDPGWRWEGGWYLVAPGDDERRQRRAEDGDEW
eukprot:6813977-Pyramimonas_sp.AAC.1